MINLGIPEGDMCEKDETTRRKHQFENKKNGRSLGDELDQRTNEFDGFFAVSDRK
jgi:hypothetical protein